MASKKLAGQYGENIAKNVQQGKISCGLTTWTLLAANGTSNRASRTHVRLQTQGEGIGAVLALHYVNGTVNANGTYSFETPASAMTVKGKTQYRGMATWVEPVGDKVNIYGRLTLKNGLASVNSVEVIVTEFS